MPSRKKSMTAFRVPCVATRQFHKKDLRRRARSGFPPDSSWYAATSITKSDRFRNRFLKLYMKYFAPFEYIGAKKGSECIVIHYKNDICKYKHHNFKP